jgi:hypothetical protein
MECCKYIKMLLLVPENHFTAVIYSGISKNVTIHRTASPPGLMPGRLNIYHMNFPLFFFLV